MTAPRSAGLCRLLLAVALPLLLATSACSEDADETPPEDALASAKQQLDETSGVELSLATGELPSGIDGILEATGTATHAPAFEGDLTVRLGSITFDVPVVSVDGTVYAKLPATSTFTEINPADYDAPDPANLMNPEGGISSWLTAASDIEVGDQTRDGDTVLTGYTGTLPGTAVADVIPSADADADFPVTFLLDGDQRLRRVEASGPFYGDDIVEYTVTFAGYDVDEEILRP